MRKSSIEHLELAIPVDKDMPLLAGEQEVFGAHRVIIDIGNTKTPSWMEAVNSFDYLSLHAIEKRNEEKMNEKSIDLYMQQAYISYFLKEFLKTYNLLKIVTKLYYKKKNYAKYFFAETNRYYVGKMIINRYFFLGISKEDRDEIEKEIKNIDLDKTFRSLPDMGGENRPFKDLYTFNFAYSLFQESYKQTKKVKEQAETTYSFFAGIPAFYSLKQSIMDLYYYEAFNHVLLDEYMENREIFVLYFSNIIQSVTIGSKTYDLVDHDWDEVSRAGNIHADRLSKFDIYVALRYFSVKDLKDLLRNIDKKLELSEETEKFFLTIIRNSEHESSKYGVDRLIWKIICLLSHFELSAEIVDAVFTIIRAATEVKEHGDYHDILNSYILNVSDHKLFDEKSLKVMGELVDAELKYLAEHTDQISLYEVILINGLYYCHERKLPYDKISVIRKLTNRGTELLCLECFELFGRKIKKYLKSIYEEWTSEKNYHDLRVYCLLVDNGIISPDNSIEKMVYDYFENNNHVAGVYEIGNSDEVLISSMTTLFLHDRVVDRKAFKSFLDVNGKEFHKWFINPERYNYRNFKADWLKRCTKKYLVGLSRKQSIKDKISHIIAEEYKRNGADKIILKIYFEYFV